jgi:hypothetical protein
VKLNLQTLTVSAFAIALGCGGLFLSTRKVEPSKASEPSYKSISSNVSAHQKFERLDCLAPLGKGKITDTFVMREQDYISPKGVPTKDFLVALKIEDHGITTYSFQAVGFRRDTCLAYYTGPDDEVPNPLSRTLSKKNSREIQLLWEKWRLENIPGWRKTMQNYLSHRKPILSDEDVYALKQLGYKLPPKWEEIK